MLLAVVRDFDSRAGGSTCQRGWRQLRIQLLAVTNCSTRNTIKQVLWRGIRFLLCRSRGWCRLEAVVGNLVASANYMILVEANNSKTFSTKFKIQKVLCKMFVLFLEMIPVGAEVEFILRE